MKNPIVPFKKTAMQLRSQRPLPCARKCRPSQFARWWTRKLKKKTGKRAEEKHTESLTKKMFVDGVGVDIGQGRAHM
jgi:hypothetical protein